MFTLMLTEVCSTCTWVLLVRK